MSNMSFSEYQAMVEDTPVSSRTVEFRDVEGRLIAVMLMDRMENSLSAVYSFFDNKEVRRSLGTYMILWMIRLAESLGMPHIYLGYWIAGSEKMSYKARFAPLEVLKNGSWTIL